MRRFRPFPFLSASTPPLYARGQSFRQLRVALLATLSLLSGLLPVAACGGPDAEGHNRAGVKHFEEGRLEESIAEYGQAIRLDSEYAAAYYNRGQAYFTLGRAQRAIEDYDEAIRLSPNRPELPLAHAGRAMAYTLLGEDEEAQQDIARAVELGYNPRRLIAAIDVIKKQR